MEKFTEAFGTDPEQHNGITFDTSDDDNIKFSVTEINVLSDEVQKGDVNGDGMVDSRDASAVMAHYADFSTQ